MMDHCNRFDRKMEPTNQGEGICQFCKTCVTFDSLLPIELSDRLNDLNALQALTNELKIETMELVEVREELHLIRI